MKHKKVYKIVCNYCGKEFDSSRKEAKFCSNECYHKWTRTQVERICQVCGKDFQCFPSLVEQGYGKFCSRDCYFESRRNKIKRICLVCGKTFLTWPSLIKRGDPKFCSQKCCGIAQSSASNAKYWEVPRASQLQLPQSHVMDSLFWLLPEGDYRRHTFLTADLEKFLNWIIWDLRSRTGGAKIRAGELKVLREELKLMDPELAELYNVSKSRIRQHRHIASIRKVEIWETKAGQFDEDQYQVVLGTALGDGYLGVPREGKYAQLALGHSEKQKDYLLWKVNWLADYFTQQLWTAVRKGQQFSSDTEAQNDRVLRAYTISSICHPSFTEIWKLLYKDGRKSISMELLKKLTPLGIAVWFMDDGSCCGRGLQLCTDCFPLKEQELICKYFSEYWNIDFKILPIKSRGHYRLRLNKKPAERFIELVKPYMLPFFDYKIKLAQQK